MGQSGALGFLGVEQQATSGANGGMQMIATKSGQIPRAELIGQFAARRFDIEFPGRATAQP